MRKPKRLPNHGILQRKANESALTYLYLAVVGLHKSLEVEKPLNNVAVICSTISFQ